MRIREIASLAAGALGLAFASSASAQEYGPGYRAPYATVPTEQVIITAPRFRYDRHYPLNTPIEGVFLSEPVRFGDLDLRTASGARELDHRVHVVAARVCGELAGMYPVSVPGYPNCYRTAVAEAQPGVDAAIETARGIPPGSFAGY